MSRRDGAIRIAELIGPDALELEDPANGWPALGTVLGLDTPIDVALYVAPVGFSHRGQDHIERRFQNPGKNRPIQPVAGRKLVYLGMWEGDAPDAPIEPAVLVTADPIRRIGNMTRASVFPRLESLQIARAVGIHVGQTTTGEEIAAFVPALFAARVHAELAGVAPDEARYRHELAEAQRQPPTERQRRISTSLARANGFARAVRDAYAGRCAMCGLGLGLVESAHILPVAARNSVDEVRNGLLLCANHHRAFDRHQIWIDPATLATRIHPEVGQAAATSIDESWISSIGSALGEPVDVTHSPDPAHLVERYRHFEGAYDWVQPPE